MTKIFNFQQTEGSKNFQIILFSTLKLKIKEKAAKMKKSFPSFSNGIKYQELHSKTASVDADSPVSPLQTSGNLNRISTLNTAPISFYTRFSAKYKANTKKQKLKDLVKKLKLAFSIKKGKAKDKLKDKLEPFIPIVVQLHEIQPLLNTSQSDSSSVTIIKSVALTEYGTPVGFIERECLLPESSTRLPLRDVSNTIDHLPPDKLANSKGLDATYMELDMVLDRVVFT